MTRLSSLPSRLSCTASRVQPPPKQVESFYTTPDYRAWRTAVLQRAGGRCQAPGCGRAERRMFADHIVERKDGGADLDLANGQCLCGRHHSLKTARARAERQRA